MFFLFLAIILKLYKERRLKEKYGAENKAHCDFENCKVNHKKKRRIDYFGFLILLILPICWLWFSGWKYHQDMFWLIRDSLRIESTSYSFLPVLDGILGTMLYGGIKGVVKGGIILSLMIFTIFIVWRLIRKLQWKNNEKNFSIYMIKNPIFLYSIALCFGLLILFIGLNQNTIWATMRFGKLILPALILVAFESERMRSFIEQNCIKLITVMIIFGLLSQSFFAWYMAKVYFV